MFKKIIITIVYMIVLGISISNINVYALQEDINVDWKAEKQDGGVLSDYDKDGYNKTTGYNRDGYDRNGYNEDGTHIDGDINVDWKAEKQDGGVLSDYNKDGYNKTTGYNRDGYDKNGFNQDGYDKDGYDKDGYDTDGDDREDNGVIDGSEESLYTKDGYSKKTGENRNGLSRNETQKLNDKVNNEAANPGLKRIAKGDESLMKSLLGYTEDNNILELDSKDKGGFSILSSFTVWLKNSISSLVMLISIGAFLYVGIRLGMARGNPEEFKKALVQLVYIIVGIFIITIAWAVVYLVAGLNI